MSSENNIIKNHLELKKKQVMERYNKERHNNDERNNRNNDYFYKKNNDKGTNNKGNNNAVDISKVLSEEQSTKMNNIPKEQIPDSEKVNRYEEQLTINERLNIQRKCLLN